MPVCFITNFNFLHRVLDREQGDVGRAIDFARGEGEADPKQYVEDQWEATKKLVRQEMDAIRRVADRLMVIDRLEDEEIKQLVDSK